MYLFEWVVSSLFLHGMYVVKLQVVKLTQRIVPHLQLPPGSHRVIVAASSHLNKFFFLDCDDGNIYVGTRNLLIDGEMMLCVPTEGSEVGREPQDGMLRWLEGYAQALHTGMFHVRTEGGSGSISLYPETSPLCTAAVTRGVQVCFVFSQAVCSGFFSWDSWILESMVQRSVNHIQFCEGQLRKWRSPEFGMSETLQAG